MDMDLDMEFGMSAFRKRAASSDDLFAAVFSKRRRVLSHHQGVSPHQSLFGPSAASQASRPAATMLLGKRMRAAVFSLTEPNSPVAKHPHLDRSSNRHNDAITTSFRNEESSSSSSSTRLDVAGPASGEEAVGPETGQQQRLPKETERFLQQGDAFFVNGQYEDALRQYNQAIECCEDTSDLTGIPIYANRAACHFYLQRYPETKSDCRKVLHINRKHWESHVLACFSALYLCEFDESMRLYQNAIAECTSDEELRVLKNRLRVCSGAHKWLKHLQRWKFDRQWSETQHTVALLAAVHSNIARGIEPFQILLLVEIGEELSATRDFEAAGRSYAKAEEMVQHMVQTIDQFTPLERLCCNKVMQYFDCNLPSLIQIRWKKATVLRNAGLNKEALEECIECLGTSSIDEGKTDGSMGLWRRARLFMSEEEDLNGFVSCTLLAAQILHQLQDLEFAEQLLQKGIERYPSHHLLRQELQKSLNGSAVDYRGLLGLSLRFTAPELKSAFKKAALAWHPDKVSDILRSVAHRVFQRINEAYKTLSSQTVEAPMDKTPNNYNPRSEGPRSAFSSRPDHTAHKEENECHHFYEGYRSTRSNPFTTPPPPPKPCDEQNAFRKSECWSSTFNVPVRSMSFGDANASRSENDSSHRPNLDRRFQPPPAPQPEAQVPEMARESSSTLLSRFMRWVFPE